MNRRVRNIMYSPLWLGLHLLALLPFRVLYIISDLLCFVTADIVGYRRRLVEANIRSSFPEKSEKEISRIIKGFYRHFTDTFVETIKLLHVSDSEMRRRIVFENVEKVDEYTKAGKSIGIYAAHYCNWEWLSSITLWADNQESIHYSQVYRPLRNKWFDSFYFGLRKRFHSDSLPKNGVLRALLGYRPAFCGLCWATAVADASSPGSFPTRSRATTTDSTTYSSSDRKHLSSPARNCCCASSTRL